MSGAWSNYDLSWKQSFKAALIAAGVYEEFYEKKETIRKLTLGQPGRKDRKTADKYAWKQVAEEYKQHFDWTAFDERYRRELAAGRSEDAIRKSIKGVAAKKRKPVGPKSGKFMIARDENIEFTYDPDAVMDVLADVKWVYINMHKLVKTDARGLTTLNTAAISDAPSAGAVGMANYALADPKAFYEKYVAKILPKEEEKPAKTFEEMQAELDPTFQDIEKYMKKLV